MIAKAPKTKKKKTNGKGKGLKDVKISRDSRSRPGLYYGSDNLRKIKLPSGEVIWVERDVHPTRT